MMWSSNIDLDVTREGKDPPKTDPKRMSKSKTGAAEVPDRNLPRVVEVVAFPIEYRTVLITIITYSLYIF